LFVITGANSGLGFETACNLASMSPLNSVVLGCRDMARGETARTAIVRATGNEHVRAMQVDVASLASVRSFATQLVGQSQRIDSLVLNAGISRGVAETSDGFDGVFETNHLGHFLLAELLLDQLAPDGRVISVSSDMHSPPGPRLRWPGVESIAYPSRRASASIRRYSYSKLCNLYFSYELSRRLRADGSTIEALAFNPGLMTDTNFAPSLGPLAAVMERVFASRLGNLTTSARALAELAAGGGGGGLVDGQYFDRTAERPARSSALSYDEANARELWEFSEQVTSQSG
jgi:NAD(P)-dependent dehydrogenase (short-subunit alcohol dehydrogenase family)